MFTCRIARRALKHAVGENAISQSLLYSCFGILHKNTPPGGISLDNKATTTPIGH
jgi:hypothetical protein